MQACCWWIILVLRATLIALSLHVILNCLHSQLFGEEDADQEVSPDTADPEAACE